MSFKINLSKRTNLKYANKISSKVLIKNQIKQGWGGVQGRVYGSV